MSLYTDYLEEIETRKGQGLHPKPIEDAEFVEALIEQIRCDIQSCYDFLAPPRQNSGTVPTKNWHRPDNMFARLSDECVGQPRPRIAGFCPPTSLNVLRILD